MSLKHYSSYRAGFSGNIRLPIQLYHRFYKTFCENKPIPHCNFDAFLTKIQSPMKDIGYFEGLRRINYRFFLYN
jgi:hypothetical protein